MTNRITLSDIEAVISRINRETDSPAQPYSKNGERYTANIGNYHLSRAYGGYCLHRMANESGGVRDVFGCGHIPARDLFQRMHAFLAGLSFQRQQEAA